MNSFGKLIVAVMEGVIKEQQANTQGAAERSEVSLPSTLATQATHSHVPKPPLELKLDSYRAGDPDFGFGDNGIALGEALLDHFYTAKGLALQRDGKIVVAGSVNFSEHSSDTNFALARYNPDGSLDTTFARGGWTEIDFDGDDDRAYAVAMQDDKIIVVGEAVNLTNYSVDFALARLNSDGKLDDTFGDRGLVLTDFLNRSSDVGRSVALQADGKIIVAGSVATFGDNPREYFALARYTPDGILDLSFGDGTGQVITNFNDTLDRAQAVCVQSDGKIVAAGSTTSSDGSQTDFALARYNPDGSVDSTFGTYGEVTTEFGQREDIAYALAIQADKKLVVAGTSTNASGRSAVLVRYNENGSLDNSFGDQGKVFVDFGGNVSTIYALALRDGQIVAVGYTAKVEDSQIKLQYGALARYDADGSPDTTFGRKGVVLTYFGGHANFISAVSLDREGKIVVAGTTIYDDFSDFVLARYYLDTYTQQQMKLEMIRQMLEQNRLNVEHGPTITRWE
jgi:uncharacterized delta-60 repeat protein